MEKTYPVVEIFDSIQGEGLNIGIPATFIRFAGCNLHCEWCDTKQSWKVDECKNMSISQIFENIGQNHIVLTGGEPTLQDLKNLVYFIKNDKKTNYISKKKRQENQSNYFISIETNGTNTIVERDLFDWITCSPKPSSNFIIKCEPNELKYVVDDNFSVEVIPNKYKNKIPIWLQPNWDDFDKSKEKAKELVMENDYLRLGFQLHKFYNIE